jgi:hypothetical protein
MAASGTQTFNPAFGELGLYALARCGIKRPEVRSDHLTDVALAGNLVLADLSTEQPNLWRIGLFSTPLVQGTVQYTMPARVLIVLDCYMRTTNAGIQNDRVIYQVGRDEYDAFPNKLLQQPPTVYWVQRTEPIVLNIYPAPDAAGPYTLFVHAIERDDDAAVGAGATLTLPFRFLKAFSDGLCKEVALTYAPERVQQLKLEYEGMDGRGGSKARAQSADRETVPMHIAPGLNRYYS